MRTFSNLLDCHCKRSKDKNWFAEGLKCSSHDKSRLYRKWPWSHTAGNENESHYKSCL